MTTPSQSTPPGRAPAYHHRQPGTVIVASCCAVIPIPFVLSAWTSGVPPSLWALWAGGLLLVILLFANLTVEIAGGHLRIRFGIGLIRKRWRLDEIEGCRPSRTSWVDGWGIRMTSGGWLYNVSGFDAVDLELKGGKACRIGTDEPQALCAALAEALAARNPPDSEGS